MASDGERSNRRRSGVRELFLAASMAVTGAGAQEARAQIPANPDEPNATAEMLAQSQPKPQLSVGEIVTALRADIKDRDEAEANVSKILEQEAQWRKEKYTAQLKTAKAAKAEAEAALAEAKAGKDDVRIRREEETISKAKEAISQAQAELTKAEHVTIPDVIAQFDSPSYKDRVHASKVLELIGAPAESDITAELERQAQLRIKQEVDNEKAELYANLNKLEFHSVRLVQEEVVLRSQTADEALKAAEAARVAKLLPMIQQLIQDPAQAKTAGEVLAEMLMKETKPGLKAELVAAIEAAGVKSATAVSGLLDSLKNQDAEVRGSAAQALGTKALEKSLGADVKMVVDGLRAALADPDPEVREKVADALGKFGADGKPALPDLIAAFTKPDVIDPKLPPHEIEAQVRANDRVREKLARTIGTFGSEAKDAVDGLVKALENPNVPVELAAVDALGNIGTAAEVKAAGPLKKLEEEPASDTQKQKWGQKIGEQRADKVRQALNNIHPR